MNVREIAEMIPAKLRETILEDNVIYKAIAVSSDPHMKILFKIWVTYVETGNDLAPDCVHCLEHVLNWYRNLKDVMITMSKEEKLLES